MSEQIIAERGRSVRWVLTGAGLLQGLGYYILAELNWSPQATGVFAAMTFLLVAPLSFQLSFGLGSKARCALACIGLGILLGLLWVWLDLRLDWSEANNWSRNHSFLFIWSMTVAAYILLPFIQTWLAEDAYRWPYPRLFQFAWNNILVFAIANVFLGVFWLVLLLWWSLFELVGVSFFYDLFTDPFFAWVFSGGVLGLGIAIARENDRIVPTFRRVVLALFQILAPVLAVASLLFLMFLPFTGLDPLWETKRATPILVILMFAVVLAVNAVIQDGTTEETKNPVIAWLIAIAVLLLPVYAGLAYYSTALRIDQYGLTPERFVARLIILVAAAHVVLYAIAVAVRRLSWSEWVCRANPYLAGAVAFMILLLQTPLLDPYRASASNQVARLLDGVTDAETFDYAYLKFRLGQPGRDALAELEALEGHPAQAEIDAGLEILRQARSPNDFARPYRPQVDFSADRAAEVRSSLTLRPKGLIVSDELWDAMVEMQTDFLRGCAPLSIGDCGILGIDSDQDGDLEYLLVKRHKVFSAVMFDEREGSFVWRVGTRAMRKGATETAWDAFLAGDYELVAPQHFDIRIGEEVLSY